MYLGRCVATRTHEFLAFKEHTYARIVSFRIAIVLHKIPAASLHNMHSWPNHYYYYKMRIHWNIFANVYRHSQRNRISLKLEHCEVCVFLEKYAKKKVIPLKLQVVQQLGSTFFTIRAIHYC